MSWRLVLGVDSRPVLEGLLALLAESDQFDLLETATTATELAESIRRQEVDVALIHEDLGPLPALDLIHELATHMPEVATVLAVRDGTADAVGAAMLAGARGVLILPPTLEELEARLGAAARWSQSVRRRLAEDTQTNLSVGGRMIAIAGAKGGTGTTTIATYLALLAAGGGAARSCLVDLDLQAGDVPSVLNLIHQRSIHDLVDVAQDISVRNLDETMYAHPSGLRVLLSPSEGELGEDVTATPARSILGAVKSHFEVAIVDCGAVVTEAGAVAVSMADQVLVTVTPDILCLRAVKRLGQLWERIGVRKESDFTVLVNRASRRSEVQPDFIRKVAGAPRARTVLPAAFPDLEKAVNAGDPDQLRNGAFRRGLHRLAQELELVRAEEGPRRRRGRRREAGSLTVEAIGAGVLIAFLAFLAFQCTLIGLTMNFASHAASEGARQAAVGAPVAAAACDDLPPRWQASCAGGIVEAGDHVEVTLDVPDVLPLGADPLMDVTATSPVVLEGP